MRKTFAVRVDEFIVSLQEFMNAEYGDWDAEKAYLPLICYITKGEASKGFLKRLIRKSPKDIAKLLYAGGEKNGVTLVKRYLRVN